ncbi:DcuS/MalK family sensor histidine kinase [Paenibacillus sp. 481]|uniref:DcuS/MalK family sensor histidine kinase n=1 Tax=Paenibacillus sp. 481 TaxID=2835869 RepID=UPI001E64DEBF|nr:DcuS/MalK family sensor histidine kinase [Paenibacillus sp. 481]UHA74837.1 DcuS/MalK family sensor histidine kinase [Paenibacillus sp. 481]
MRYNKPRISLQATIMLLVCSVVALALLVTGIMIEWQTARNTELLVEEKAKAVARTIATIPIMAEALSGGRTEEEIQRYADDIRVKTGMQYVVVMDMEGIRKSHPDPKQIGKPFVGGDEKVALAGSEHVSFGEGTLGKSLRAFKPIRTVYGTQVGVVAVGISLESVEHAVMKNRWIIYLGLVLGGITGIGGALILARKIKRVLFGLEPSAIAHLLEERNAMLQSAREGIVAVDHDFRITLINEEARRLFAKAGVKQYDVGHYVDDVVSGLLRRTLRTGESVLDAEFELQGLTVLANSVPICVQGTTVGIIATFRDKTELSQLAERLTGVRLYADALRAQAHEFMNKLHVILGLVHIGAYDRLEGYVSEVASRHQTEVGLIMRQVNDPVLAGFLLGKMSKARESGLTLVLSETSYLPEPNEPSLTHEFITIMGNLTDNAIEALIGIEHGQIIVDVQYMSGSLHLQMKDNGPGIPDHVRQHMFEKGFSTKGEDRGYGLFLLQRSVNQLGGQVKVDSLHGAGSTFTVSIPYPIKGEL